MTIEQLNIIGFISTVFSAVYLKYVSFTSSDGCFEQSNTKQSEQYDIEAPNTNSVAINIGPIKKYSLGYDLENNDTEIVAFDWKRNISF